MMARKWNLPAEFSTMVAEHTKADILSTEFRAHWGQVAVALSSLLPSVTDDQWHDCMKFEQTFAALRPIGNPRVPQVLEQVDREFQEFAPVLKLPSPAKSLVTVYDEVASMSENQTV